MLIPRKPASLKATMYDSILCPDRIKLMSDRDTPDPLLSAPSEGALTPASINGLAGNSAAEFRRGALDALFTLRGGLVDGVLVVVGVVLLLIEEF